MAFDHATRLRSHLGEAIPPGGVDTDTMFTNEEIADILLFMGTSTDTNANLYLAAAEGWERKASRLAELVTMQSGGAQRMMSDLHTHAAEQAKHYRELGERRSYARAGTIVRPGTTIR